MEEQEARDRRHKPRLGDIEKTVVNHPLVMSREALAIKINTLPEWARIYIHHIETRCDPTGDVQTIADLREQVNALSRENLEQSSLIATLEGQLRDLQLIAGEIGKSENATSVTGS